MKKKCKYFQNSLLNARLNEEYIIKKINSKLSFEAYRRLCELGVLPGEKIVLLRHSLGGAACLVSVRNLVYSIKASVASLVEVGRLE